jgi:hypothetical protein
MATVHNRTGLQQSRSIPLSQNKFEEQLDKLSAHKSQPLPHGMSIIFINGILNHRCDSLESAVDISKSIRNKKVTSVFNNTYDFQNGVEKTVDALTNKILRRAEKCKIQLRSANKTKDICIVIIAHSHGASVLEQSLSDKRIDAHLKQRIRIITIGAAAVIPSPGYRSVINIINEWDFVPFVTHTDFENMRESDDFVKCATAFFQENLAVNILKIKSHKKILLNERILWAMQASWGPTPPTDVVQIEIRKLCEKVVASTRKNEVFQKNPPQNVLLMNLASMIISVAINYSFYDINVMKSTTQKLEIEDLLSSHSVKSYIPHIAPILTGYIADHS